MLTLEETIQGNINTVDHGTVLSACPAPFSLTEFLFLSALFSFWFHSSPASLIYRALQSRPFFPYLAKGRTTRIKLVLARPKGFVLSELWQVTVTMMSRIINHYSVFSRNLIQNVRCEQVPAVCDEMLQHVFKPENIIGVDLQKSHTDKIKQTHSNTSKPHHLLFIFVFSVTNTDQKSLSYSSRFYFLNASKSC